jgi:probable rRNA maturation factor
MILIKNRIKKIKIDEKKIKAGIEKMLAFISYEDFDIGLLCTTNETIRHYNKTFRHKDKATDILSFPYHTDLKPGERIVALEMEDKSLGDLIISLECAAKDAKEREWELDEYILMLIAHGIAHLLGHDHMKDDDYEEMQILEKKLLKASF